uniref:Zinc carboxypeptidase A 1 n=1 Tax=Parastrongyloides trichosuri TaxID=131310 RepID=A0A0N4ZWR9_PARTI
MTAFSKALTFSKYLYIFIIFISLSSLDALRPYINKRFQDDTAPKHFKDYKLYRINPRNQENLEYLKDLFTHDSPYELDFWQPPTHIGGLVDVSVNPEDAKIFARDLDSKQLDYSVAINDLQEAIIGERNVNTSSDLEYLKDNGYLRHDKYNTFEQIEEYLRKLELDYPELVNLIEIGKSHENRSLTVVKIGAKRPYGCKKLGFWIDAGIHAREWIAPATALIFIDKLIKGYNDDALIKNYLDDIDFYILPIMNPDGYVYSHTSNRMWRKNRRPAQCKKNYFHTICCAGVDLNRNFDWFWASAGSSSDLCHETFHGSSAFSEPESRAVKEFLEKNSMKSFISLHSYSQLWLIPYAHRRRSYPQDYATNMRPLALKATKAINKMHGTKYAVGTGADLMYEAAGGSHDFAKGVLKIPYSYLVELRPKNSMMANGFLLPESEIIETGEETFEAIKVISDELIGQFGRPKDPACNVKPILKTTKKPKKTTRIIPTTEEPTTTKEEVTTTTTEEPTTTVEEVITTTTEEVTTTTTYEPTTTTEEITTTTTQEPTTTKEITTTELNLSTTTEQPSIEKSSSSESTSTEGASVSESSSSSIENSIETTTESIKFEKVDEKITTDLSKLTTQIVEKIIKESTTQVPIVDKEVESVKTILTTEEAKNIETTTQKLEEITTVEVTTTMKPELINVETTSQKLEEITPNNIEEESKKIIKNKIHSKEVESKDVNNSSVVIKNFPKIDENNVTVNLPTTVKIVDEESVSAETTFLVPTSEKPNSNIDTETSSKVTDIILQETTTTTEEPTTTSTTTTTQSTKISKKNSKKPKQSTTFRPELLKKPSHCKDYGSYCKWWKIHDLCDKPRVRQLCASSCLPECR